MSTVHHVSFEEFVGNLVEILNKVRDEQTTVVVEYATGEKLVIKALVPVRQDASKDQPDQTRQRPPNRTSSTDNISSVGAVYDLDPDSITPG